jgi:hypothetical protein
MRLPLQDKIDRDLALNLSELMSATGYGRVQIKRMGVPMVEGKIQLKDFWKHHAKLAHEERGPITGASLEPPNDLRLIVNRMRAPVRRMPGPIASTSLRRCAPRLREELRETNLTA